MGGKVCTCTEDEKSTKEIFNMNTQPTNSPDEEDAISISIRVEQPTNFIHANSNLSSSIDFARENKSLHRSFIEEYEEKDEEFSKDESNQTNHSFRAFQQTEPPTLSPNERQIFHIVQSKGININKNYHLPEEINNGEDIEFVENEGCIQEKKEVPNFAVAENTEPSSPQMDKLLGEYDIGEYLHKEQPETPNLGKNMNMNMNMNLDYSGVSEMVEELEGGREEDSKRWESFMGGTATETTGVVSAFHTLKESFIIPEHQSMHNISLHPDKDMDMDMGKDKLRDSKCDHTDMDIGNVRQQEKYRRKTPGSRREKESKCNSRRVKESKCKRGINEVSNISKRETQYIQHPNKGGAKTERMGEQGHRGKGNKWNSMRHEKGSIHIRGFKPSINILHRGDTENVSPSPSPQLNDSANISLDLNGHPLETLRPHHSMFTARKPIDDISNEFIVQEGEILKYKQGVRGHYIPRWGVVTHSAFRYYKSRWAAHCWLAKPLAYIPFSHIKHCRRINPFPEMKRQKIGSKIMMKRNSEYSSSMFELFLIHKYLGATEHLNMNSMLNLSSGINSITKRNPTTILDNSNFSNNSSLLLPPIPRMNLGLTAEKPPVLSPLKDNLQSIHASRRLNSPDPDDINHSPSVKEGHLMRSPGRHQLNTYRSHQEDNPIPNKEEGKRKSVCIEGLNFESHEQHKEYYEYIFVHSKWLNKNCQSSINTNQSSPKLLRAKETWSHREVDWYNAESTYIFSAKNKQQTQKWVSIISWLIHKANDNLSQ